MAETKTIRLNKVLREFNISLDRAVEFLGTKGFEVEARPTTKISSEEYDVLFNEFQTDKSKKVEAKEVGEEKRKEKEELRLEREREIEEKQVKVEPKVIKAEAKLNGPKQVGKIDLNPAKAKKEEEKPVKKEEEKPAVKVEEKPIKAEKKVEEKTEEKKEDKKPVKKVEEKVVKKEISVEEESEESDTVKTQYKKLDGPNFTGEKIDLTKFKKPEKKTDDKKKSSDNKEKKNRRRRISKESPNNNRSRDNRAKGRSNVVKEEPSEEEVQKQVRETLEKLQGKSSKGKGAKYRREKRDSHRQKSEDELAQQEADSKLLKVTEFVTVSEVATMMNVPVTQIISACMSLGMMVTMNQRLDAETLSIVAEEFGFEVEFITADIEESIQEVEDNPEDLVPRAPIVTVMGHVDHGKTSLLDYIREENVIAGESGGITQHIGAYAVQLENGQKITFLDTPGHEAFTAMRARGAQVTDLAIIVVAADDDIMPQTKEAISHAQAAGVPIVFAINKIDKPTANPDKIKEGLANMNLLVEDWGGKIQSQDISAKTGDGVKELLEKVLLEAELLELKANPDRLAYGTVVEAFLDKGRGYVSTILVQGGTLKVGDYVLAGQNSGKVKAMHDERGNSIKEAG
ncbi:MAG TPA: translation initiation factor IF-2, partial [Flavobacteriaceae bacterium]|nr:translation initiation factor IF-2 [Flavobacteriaceae bacterium]